MSLASPGQGCDCSLKGGLGYFFVGSSRSGGSVLFSPAGAANVGETARVASPRPSPPISFLLEILLVSFMMLSLFLLSQLLLGFTWSIEFASCNSDAMKAKNSMHSFYYPA